MGILRYKYPGHSISTFTFVIMSTDYSHLLFSILYRVESMNFPKSVSNISLLCRTNNLASTSPSVISATIIKILTVIYQKCPTAIIHVLSILPQFDHDAMIDSDLFVALV